MRTRSVSENAAARRILLRLIRAARQLISPRAHALSTNCITQVSRKCGMCGDSGHMWFAIISPSRSFIGNISAALKNATFGWPTGVVSLAIHRFVLLPVVEEQVVQKPGPRGGAGVKMELPAEQEVVVGYVQAVL